MSRKRTIGALDAVSVEAVSGPKVTLAVATVPSCPVFGGSAMKIGICALSSAVATASITSNAK
ncbi:MAG: hypothetical protein U0Q16_06010 [Bryobacteraceae bacterium]